MQRQIERGNKERLIERLQKAIDAEHTTYSCFKYLSELVKNGRIKSQLIMFAEEAERNKKSLLMHLANLGEENFIVEDTCQLCKVTPESFSLFGALNLGLELTHICAEIYTQLSAECKSSGDTYEFEQLLQEKHRQRGFLKKELKFVESHTSSDFMTETRVPYVGKI